MLCANKATQMLVRQLEGCKKVERYCESCAQSNLRISVKLPNQSQDPTSGIFSGGSGSELKLTLGFCASSRSLVAS